MQMIYFIVIYIDHKNTCQYLTKINNDLLTLSYRLKKYFF